MNKKFGISFLVLCFGASSVNVALADQIVNPVAMNVDLNQVEALHQQTLTQDRQNRDEEIAIRGMIQQNNQLTQTTLANQEDEGLKKINQTMLDYDNGLVARDRERIQVNSQPWSSRYGDLVKLTEDADNMTVHQDLENKSGMLAEKFQMLEALRNEMAALNNKLVGQGSASNQKDSIIASYHKIAQQQAGQIQSLVQRLGEMDKRLSHIDDIIAQKDRQIEQLKYSLAQAQSESAAKDETIKEQQNQISILMSESKISVPALKAGSVELPPVIVNATGSQLPAPRVIYSPSLVNQLAQVRREIYFKDGVIKQQRDQLDLLKSELEDKITQEKIQTREIASKNEAIRQQENAIAMLKAQSQDLNAKEERLQSQADQMTAAAARFKNQGEMYANIQAQVRGLKNTIHEQDIDLKARNNSIRWLNQLIAVLKNKAKYYQLTSQEDRLSMRQVQQQIQQIKDDFVQRFKNYNQFEGAIVSLKAQVGQLYRRLAQKQNQVDLLKKELEDKITQENNHRQQQERMRQDIKSQLEGKESQIAALKADVLNILQKQTQKGEALNENITLAQQLIGLQEQESALLDEKSELALRQYDIFDRHFDTFENRMKRLEANRNLQDMDARNRMDTLESELSQEQQEVNALKAQLEEKIANQNNVDRIQIEIRDLRAQLRDKEDQIISMKTQMQSGQVTYEEAESLRQQLAAQQEKAKFLKQQLDTKTAQANQMTLMMSDYQQKLESRNNAYNEQLGQVLSSKNYEAQMETQIADLNARLRFKEAQVVKIKKDMYDLQESMSDKDRDTQAKDLSLSMIQQKVMDEKVNVYQNQINALQTVRDSQLQEIKTLRTELAMSRQQLTGMPSSDEIDFLRTGLDKATAQLKEKDEALSQAKAAADEYETEFKKQSSEFESVKQQLQDAQDDLGKRVEDLKYKNMEIIRLKERFHVGHGDSHENKVEVLQAKLMDANAQIKFLKKQLDEFILPAKQDTVREKLKQAVEKIDQQGRIINVLAQKLQACGQNVDLTKLAR